MKELFSILIIAIGLSMDSLTVSLAAATACKTKSTFVFLRFAFTLGFIQAAFTVAGWAAGAELGKYFMDFDHWIAFGLLLLIGGKMLYEGFKHRDSGVKREINMNNFFVVTGLGIATSIDAAVVGVSLSFVGVNIWISSAIILIVTFVFSYFGLFSGNVIRKKLKKFPIEIVGGLFLIGIGIKVLIEHLSNGC
jgi:putative Mn2+ efflux pump MntP